MTSVKARLRRPAGQGYRAAHKWVGLLRSSLLTPYTRVNYVVEAKDWSIAWDGRYITEAVTEQTGVACQTVRRYQGIRNQVVHFGSRNVYLRGGYRNVDASNRVVFTWFHGNESDPNPENQAMIRALPEAAPLADKIVTSSSIGRERLIGWGVPDSKITVIPLGIDLDIFKPLKGTNRSHLREQLGIPHDAICIGSFQKDGVGWGDGMEPKLIKGPDIFLSVIERLAPNYKLFVLLTGPARGYVKKGLDELGVPCHHTYLKNYHDIAPLFSCLDLYMVTSRDEGGPKAILECMATGVPIISTRVGMAEDVIHDYENGILTDIEDCDALATDASELIENASLKDRLAQNGLTTAAQYDWKEIGMRYYKQVYQSLLSGARPGRI